MKEQAKQAALVSYQREVGRIVNCVAFAWAYSYPVANDEYLMVVEPRDARPGDLSRGLTNLDLRIRRGRQVLSLRVNQRFSITDDDLSISTIKYYYSVWLGKNLRLIDFHYHRRQNAGPDAHLHLRDDSGQAIRHQLLDRHIPTGRVPLEDVIRFLITEMNIEPRTQDWEQVLEETEATFRANRSW